MKHRFPTLASVVFALCGCGGGGIGIPDSGFDGTGVGLPPADPGTSIVVDHRQAFATAALIPDAWMIRGRSLQVMFAHRSVGLNILDGLRDLQGHDSARYAVDIVSYPSDNPAGCVSEFIVGTDGDPQSKLVDFQTRVNAGAMPGMQVAILKFCFVDFTAATDVSALVDGYESTMAQLEAGHPGVSFVYCTVPITATFMATRQQFNDQLRAYCSTNDKALFDIASIEAYDPADNPIGGAQPLLYSGYAQPDGEHLNPLGSVRVARAWWWLMARLAGWSES